MTPGAVRLPDFRERGTLLRAAIGAHVLLLLTVAVAEPDPLRWGVLLYAMARVLEPALAVSLLVVAGIGPRFTNLPPWQAWLSILAIADLATILVHAWLAPSDIALWRALWWTALAVASIALWLQVVVKTRSPELAEARFMALSARIRPHFLFNSLNGILGIIRSDPRRAETALEELAELFRALMQDPRQLVPLSEEIALCRQYIELERLRLGERVRVSWDIDRCPPDAMMPPLVLQPLLENAVYHGIEPATEPGVIDIRLLHSGTSVVIVISNPSDTTSARSPGNQMALANIRERLQLFYEQAASLESEARDGRYTVHIVLPYRRRAI